MMPLHLLFAAFCCVLAVPVLVFAAQIAVSFLPARPRTGRAIAWPRIAVLVPAHDESAGIEACLRSIVAQLRDADRLLVVADNCSDDTAARARTCGAEVVERRDEARRGKGYALDFGIRCLAAAPPDVVLVMDADCRLQGGALDRLARRCAESGLPVQALYLMQAPRGAGLKTRIAAFAWAVKNHARALGYQRLGLPCQLMGTGMAFPWQLIREADLASGHLVEDLKLGLELASQRRAAVFCPEAVVTSVFPSSSEGARSQRTRWEHGHLAMLLHDGPVYLLKSLATSNPGLLALTLDLWVPPLALLTLAVIAACGIGFALWMLTGAAPLWFLALPLLLLALLAASVLLAWTRYGRGILSLGSLAYAPMYALGKIPLYLGFIIRRQVQWVRSRRD